MARPTVVGVDRWHGWSFGDLLSDLGWLVDCEQIQGRWNGRQCKDAGDGDNLLGTPVFLRSFALCNTISLIA